MTSQLLEFFLLANITFEFRFEAAGKSLAAQYYTRNQPVPGTLPHTLAHWFLGVTSQSGLARLLGAAAAKPV